MLSEVRVGVIGMGHWGPNLARNFMELGVLQAICERDPALLEKYTALYPHAECYKDAEEMCSSNTVNAVAIATPAVTHGTLAEMALNHGMHVFVEKPLCLDIEQARRLKEMASNKSRLLMVGHLLLYHPAFVELKRLVHDGELGEIRYIYSHRLSLGKIRREENALWSFAPHDVSMILTLLDAMPDAVIAKGGHYLTHGVEDTTLTHMTFAGGVRAHIFVSWLHPFKDHRMIVVGERGMAVFDDTLGAEEKLKLYNHGVEWNGDVPEVTKAQSKPIPLKWVEPLRMECETFIRCITSDDIPPSNADEGISVLQVLHAAQQSIHDERQMVLKGNDYI